MWIILIGIVIVVVVVIIVKNKAAENEGAGMQEDPDVFMAKSEFAAKFAEYVCEMFNAGGEHFQWMMANSKERMFKLEFTKQGVLFKKIEVSRSRLKETGTYDVASSGIGFGATGYQDLPNGKYVSAFRRYILEEVKKNCPYVTVDTNDYVKLSEDAKKSW